MVSLTRHWNSEVRLHGLPIIPSEIPFLRLTRCTSVEFFVVVLDEPVRGPRPVLETFFNSTQIRRKYVVVSFKLSNQLMQTRCRQLQRGRVDLKKIGSTNSSDRTSVVLHFSRRFGDKYAVQSHELRALYAISIDLVCTTYCR